MLRREDFQCARFDGTKSHEELRMNVCTVQSVQRVVNFTLDDGRMLPEQPVGGVIPGVTMICDLPLLFVNGLPTCLENLSVSQMETFIPYMVQCSEGVFKTGTKPKWWPDEVNFSATIIKPSSLPNSKWLCYLKRIVSSCYSYHGCDYALRLCVDSSHKCSSEWTCIDGLDGTMSLYNKVTGKLSATFRTSNMACFKGGQILAKALVLKRTRNNGMPRNSPISIYLCDTCDREFSTWKEVQDHEKQCSRKQCISIPNLRETHPNPTRIRRTNVLLHKTTSNSKAHTTCASGNQSSQRNSMPRKTLAHCRSRRSMHLESTIHQCSYLKEVPCKDRNNCSSIKKKQVCESSRSNKPGQTVQTSRETTSSTFQTNLLHSVNVNNLKLKIKNTLANDRISPETPDNWVVEVSPKSKKMIFRRMSLIPSKQNQLKDPNQVPQSDIYLCDHCEMDFTTLKDIQDHELLFCKKNREFTASPVISEAEQEFNQDTFLNYFKLRSASHPRLKLKLSDSSNSKRTFRNPLRYSGIPVSSPLGRHVHNKTHISPAVIFGKMKKIERYCSSNPFETLRSSETKFEDNTWQISYKPSKNTTKNGAHTYRYPLKKWWRMPSLTRKLMEIEERNQRLRSLCKPLKVTLQRLTSKEIENFTSGTVSTKVKNWTSKEIELYIKQCSVSPRLRRLSTQEIEAYTTPCSITPVLRRLSVQEIEKYTKSAPSITLDNTPADIHVEYLGKDTLSSS